MVPQIILKLLSTLYPTERGPDRLARQGSALRCYGGERSNPGLGLSDCSPPPVLATTPFLRRGKAGNPHNETSFGYVGANYNDLGFFGRSRKFVQI
ncbi:hypothetical protein ElyMa_004063100 [Elysia marginata]|uniref:Uncharacterized protein n=1 Tax=Elysia marginata TaxID=1093978 RepID=A0AAV4G802_9GAST|nr:hypothetical protein ElyMa_004063100 [Elysia marginata]